MPDKQQQQQKRQRHTQPLHPGARQFGHFTSLNVLQTGQLFLESRKNIIQAGQEPRNP
jgi:hypothetical protein